MKMTSLFLAIFISIPSLFAANFEVIGPCSERPLLSVEVNASSYETIGDLTIHQFNKNKVPFLGDERGINQIFNSPLGLDALEVISDTQMLAYGWCYSVDGVVSMEYPIDYYTDDKIKNVTWFYGYSRFDKTQWISMCEPSYKRKSAFICK